MYLEDKELATIYGGVTINATFLNAISRAVTTVYNIGYQLGSTIIRLVTGKTCKL